MISSAMNTTETASNTYLDLSGVHAIRAMGAKDKDKALHEIASQFESMMVRMMLKSMRDANQVFAQDNLLSSHEGDTYQQMYDDQLALSLAQGKGIGLAEIMAKQLKGRFSDASTVASQSVDAVPQSTALHSDVATGNSAIGNPVTGGNMANSNVTGANIVNSNSVKNIAVKSDVTSINSSKKNMTNDSAEMTGQMLTNTISFDGSVKNFVDHIHSMAVTAAQQLGVSPDILIAQSALETGWGVKINQTGNGYSSFNLFNIKADNRWQGETTMVPTLEFRQGLAVKETAAFRSYASPQESFDDYVAFVNNNPRYASAVASSDSETYIRSLSAAGYATDPQYAEKVLRIVNSEAFKDAMNQISARAHAQKTPVLSAL